MIFSGKSVFSVFYTYLLYNKWVTLIMYNIGFKTYKAIDALKDPCFMIRYLI
jgi:hypothetical protein